MRKITPEDLVLYLYKETSPQRTKAIEAALETDWLLQDAYEQLVSTQKQLKEVFLSPRDEAIKRILDPEDKTISHLSPH